MTTIEKIKAMIDQITAMLEAGKTLQQVTKATYEKREAGEDMIYFGIADKTNDPATNCIMPRPIAKQKEYYQFFNETAPGFNVLSRYTLYIYQDGHVEFVEKKKVDEETIRTNL